MNFTFRYLRPVGDMMMSKSKFFEPLCASVASGHSIKESASLCGCSIQTAYNLSAQNEFRSRVSAIRSEITAEAVGVITHAATLAARTLVELLGPANEPSVRMNAAKAILLQLKPLTELGELRARIDKIEGTKLKVVAG